MKTKSAFTVVELLVVVSIIAILSAIAVFAYEGAQKDSRDSIRKGNTTVISEALEKYYDKNGEYPSVASLVNNNSVTGQAAASKLGIAESNLKMPRLPSGTTNPLTSTDPPTNDNISYIGLSDINNSRCQSDTASGCDQYTLKYITETGQTITINSRHRARPDSAPTTPDDLSPSLALSAVPPNVVATATPAAPCNPSTLTMKYAFTYRSKGGNDASWSTWTDANTTWSTSKTYSITGTEGMAYEYMAYTRCDNGATPGTSSAASVTKSLIYQLGAPAAPTVSTSLASNGLLTFTLSAVSCPSGSTAQYAYRRGFNENGYYAWSSWGAGRAWSHSTDQGYKYFYEGKARCHMTNTDSAEAVGAETVYIRPIDAPATAPNVVVSAAPTRIDWNWDAPTCPTGTTVLYQVRRMADWGYDSGWGTTTTATNWYWNTTNQGYEFTVQVQSRCDSAYINGAWSATGAASYIRPVDPPAAPTGFVHTTAADRLSHSWEWTAPTCGTSARAEYSYDAYVNGGGYYWTSTGTSGWRGWSTRGYYTPKVTSSSSTPYPVDTVDTQVRVKYTCVNSSTGRTSAEGPIGTSAMVKI